MRILVVEDERDLNRVISKRLESEGYSVDRCFDGQEALDFIEAGDFDAIIMDIMMPKLSIKRQTDKMSKLVSELLMISRMDKNTMTLNFEVTDISELLKFVCDEQEELNQNSTRLVRNIRDNVVAKLDRGSMTRLLVNLISNAYKFTEAGGEVTVSLSESKSSVSISVKGSGIGISKDELPKIWERFYQADTARTHNENSGAGLGLSMVKWIAEKHNGKVTVESEPGKGSEFVFTFPK
ncbi:MAG: response regulator [Ruminococcaceae bacterium]|nr:response regulator [Oscillospiraceae bacterium]